MKKLFHNRKFLGWAGMIIGSMIYCFAVIFIFDKAEFYASGFTGICQILANDIFGVPRLKSILVALVNAPLFLLAFKKVSKNFAILSLGSVIVQTICLYFFQVAYDNGFDPFKSFVYEVIGPDGTTHMYGQMAMSLLGGALSGVGLGIALKYGASTGGMDIVSQAYSFKTGFPFAIISFSLDMIVVIMGWIIKQNFAVGVYTVVRIVICTITIDSMYKTYRYYKIVVITTNIDAVKEKMAKEFVHGITIYDCMGGYAGEKRYTLETVCLRFEVEEYIGKVKMADPNAFIYYSDVKGLSGKFNKRTIS